nr:hypothetical protein 2 - mouse [Mus musculus]
MHPLAKPQALGSGEDAWFSSPFLLGSPPCQASPVPWPRSWAHT